jgi:hypothetical protein
MHLEGVKPAVASGKIVAGGTSSLLFSLQPFPMPYRQPENFGSLHLTLSLSVHLFSTMH